MRLQRWSRGGSEGTDYSLVPGCTIITFADCIVPGGSYILIILLGIVASPLVSGVL